MEANKILQADLLDIVFEDRNKDYGAYELRKKYNKRITLALAITAAIAIIAVGSSFIAKQLNSTADDKVVHEVSLKNLEDAATTATATAAAAKNTSATAEGGADQVHASRY
jgi:protein TonB